MIIGIESKRNEKVDHYFNLLNNNFKNDNRGFLFSGVVESFNVSSLKRWYVVKLDILFPPIHIYLIMGLLISMVIWGIAWFHLFICGLIFMFGFWQTKFFWKFLIKIGLKKKGVNKELYNFL
jgi:hypothetical protein